MLKVYLAGKVGGMKWDVVKGRTDVKCVASDGGDHSEHKWGWAHYDFGSCNGVFKDSLEQNFLEQLRGCDVLIAYLDTPDSYGSVAEIATASAWGIPSHVIVADPTANIECDALWRRPIWGKTRSEMCVVHESLYDAYWFVCSLPNVTVHTPDTWQGVKDAAATIIDQHKPKPKATPLWAEEPATPKQVKYLRGLGYHGPDPKTKGEAGKLIGGLQDKKRPKPQRMTRRPESQRFAVSPDEALTQTIRHDQTNGEPYFG